MELAHAIARLSMAALLLVAGAAKVRDFGGTRIAVQNFGVPARFAVILGGTVLALEIALGFGLLWAMTGRVAAIGATFLFCIFAFTIALNLAAGRAPDCHCFGQTHSKPVNWGTFGRASALAGVAAWLALSPPTPLPLDVSLFLGAPEVMIFVILFGLVCLVGGWILSLLMQQQGRLLLRLDAIEAKLGIGPADQTRSLVELPGLRVGAAAPDFELETRDGDLVSLASLLAGGRADFGAGFHGSELRTVLRDAA